MYFGDESIWDTLPHWVALMLRHGASFGAVPSGLGLVVIQLNSLGLFNRIGKSTQGTLPHWVARMLRHGASSGAVPSGLGFGQTILSILTCNVLIFLNTLSQMSGFCDVLFGYLHN